MRRFRSMVAFLALAACGPAPSEPHPEIKARSSDDRTSDETTVPKDPESTTPIQDSGNDVEQKADPATPPPNPLFGKWMKDCEPLDMTDVKSMRLSYGISSERITFNLALYEQPGCQGVREIQDQVYSWRAGGQVTRQDQKWDSLEMTAIHYYRSAHSSGGLAMLNDAGRSCGVTFKMYNPVDAFKTPSCESLLIGAVPNETSTTLFSVTQNGELETMGVAADAQPFGPFVRAP